MSWSLLLPQDKGGVGLYEPEDRSVSNGGPQDPKLRAGTELDKGIGQLPPDQQQQLGKLYMFLTQHPEARVQLRSFGDVKRAMDNYQVCLKCNQYFENLCMEDHNMSQCHIICLTFVSKFCLAFWAYLEPDVDQELQATHGFDQRFWLMRSVRMSRSICLNLSSQRGLTVH